MTYSRKYLNKISNPGYRNKKEFKRVADDLINKALSGSSITGAEGEFICGIIKILRDERGNYKFDITKIPACQCYRFRDAYLLNADDLNGQRPRHIPPGLIPVTNRTDDLAFLDAEFKAWDAKLKNAVPGNDMLGYLVEEVNQHVNLLNRYAQRNGLGKSDIDYWTKSIILHSRYIYLLVDEFYQELGTKSEILNPNRKSILIDSFCYIHTLFRHFAAIIKNYQTGKSYHFDEGVQFSELPWFLKKVIQSYLRNTAPSEFNGRSMDIIFNGKPYAIWFRQVGSHLRVQTFYPVDSKEYLRKLRKRKRVKVSSKLTLLVERGLS